MLEKEEKMNDTEFIKNVEERIKEIEQELNRMAKEAADDVMEEQECTAEEQELKDKLGEFGCGLFKTVERNENGEKEITYTVVDTSNSSYSQFDFESLEEVASFLEEKEEENTKKLYYTHGADDFDRQTAQGVCNEIRVLSGILFRLLDGEMDNLKSDDIDLESLWQMLQDLWDGSYILQKAED